MKTGFAVFFRLAWMTYFPGGDPLARRTWRRLLVMTFFLPVFLLVQSIHWIALGLDELLFPSYRRIEVKRPLFIVGVPRSGTTFLHRLLAGDSERFTTFPLWELLLAPAITEKVCWITIDRIDRLVGRPLFHALRKAEGLLFGQLDQIHKTSLLDPEEDYLSLLPICACFLLVLAFPHQNGIWPLAYFDEWPEDQRRPVMRFYKRMVQRHLYVRGQDKELLSKNPSFSALVQSLPQTFPDCRIVCNLRNPYEAIPSLLSTMMDGARVFGNDCGGSGYRDQLVGMLEHFYRHLIAVLPEMAANRHAFVRFNDLTANPRGVVQSVYERLQYAMSPTFADVLQLEQERARGYRSKHRYTLEQFDLNPESIQRQLEFVFSRFDFSPDHMGPAHVATPDCSTGN